MRTDSLELICPLCGHTTNPDLLVLAGSVEHEGKWLNCNKCHAGLFRIRLRDNVPWREGE